jgi:hypothetical protein
MEFETEVMDVFSFKSKEDYLNFDMDLIRKSERIMSHIQLMGFSKGFLFFLIWERVSFKVSVCFYNFSIEFVFWVVYTGIFVC